MARGAWKAAVHGVTEGQTRLSDFTFTFHFHALEKEMATHSSVLAWRIPGTGDPGGLLSMGSHKVGHNWSDLGVAVAVTVVNILRCKTRWLSQKQNEKFTALTLTNAIVFWKLHRPGLGLPKPGKESSAMQDTLFQFLDQEDPLEKR